MTSEEKAYLKKVAMNFLDALRSKNIEIHSLDDKEEILRLIRVLSATTCALYSADDFAHIKKTSCEVPSCEE